MTETVETPEAGLVAQRRLMTLIVAELMLDGIEGNAGRIADYFEERGVFCNSGPDQGPKMDAYDPALVERGRRIAKEASDLSLARAADRATRTQA